MMIDMAKAMLAGVYGAGTGSAVAWGAARFAKKDKNSWKYWIILLPGFLLVYAGYRILFNMPG